MEVSTIITLIIIGVLIYWLVGIYNKLVTLKNRYQNAFSQIEVQLKRRYDLIPNLIETAKGYIKHERETLEAVVNARNQALSGLEKAAADPGSPAAMLDLGQAESMLAGALRGLNVVVEATFSPLNAPASMLSA